MTSGGNNFNDSSANQLNKFRANTANNRTTTETECGDVKNVLIDGSHCLWNSMLVMSTNAI